MPKKFLNARFYEPRNGRFITRDTYRGESDNADTWHLYLYCANNPINYVDPSGHSRGGLAMRAGFYLVKGTVSKGIIITTINGAFAIAGVIATVYIVSKLYKKVKVYYSKGGKKNVKDTGLAGYSDAEVSSLARDKSLSAKERGRFVTEEKARKKRNKQKRNNRGRKR